MSYGKIRANSLEHSSQGSLNTQYVVGATPKAWVNYNGQTNTLNDSFNTSSVSDQSTGRQYWNNTNSFVNSDGAGAGMTARTGISGFSGLSGNIMRSTSQWDMNTTTSDTEASQDAEWSCIGVGDLA